MDISEYAREFERRIGLILENRYPDPVARVVSGARLANGDRSQAFIADYAVYVARQMAPSLVIEVKIRVNSDVLHRLIASARRLRMFKQGETRFILVTPDKKTEEPVFYDLTSFIDESDMPPSLESLEALDHLPDLNALTTSARVSSDKRVKRQIDKFKWTCVSLGLAAIAFLVFDYFTLYELSWERLALLAAICVLLLLPHVSLIKYGDLELYSNSDYIDKDKVVSA